MVEEEEDEEVEEGGGGGREGDGLEADVAEVDGELLIGWVFDGDGLLSSTGRSG